MHEFGSVSKPMLNPQPLKRFMWMGLLWLPAMFFVWLWFAEPLVWPVSRLAGWILLHSWSAVFDTVEQRGFLVEIATHVLVNQPDSKGQLRMGALVLTANPLVYGYSLPLFCTLVTTTPLPGAKRILQIIIGMIVIEISQAFGVVAEALKLVAFDAGQQGVLAIAQNGLSKPVIGLIYQFGYLILPAIVPILLWTMFNNGFFEILTNRQIEPVGQNSVEPGH